MAFRTPISRVRSATDTNMMFMIPMPPTNNESPVINKPTVPIVPATLLNTFTICSCWLMAKSSGSPGARCRAFRISPRNSSFASSTWSSFVTLTWISKSGLRV